MNVIELENGLNAFDHDGTLRVLAALPPPVLFTATEFAPAFSSAFPVIPRNQWVEKSLRYFQVPIMDQGQHGSCSGHGSAAAAMNSLAVDGHDPVLLAPNFIYALVNHGRDNGAVISDAAQALTTHGCCLMSEFGEETIYQQQIPPQAFQTAQRFRAKVFKINTPDELGSCLMLDMPVISGFAVGRNFNHLDSEFIPPLPDVIAGGHCTCQLGLKHSGHYGWVFDSVNSWSASWGDRGYFSLRPEHFSGQYGFGFDCWGVQIMYADSQDPDPAPAIH